MKKALVTSTCLVASWIIACNLSIAEPGGATTSGARKTAGVRMNGLYGTVIAPTIFLSRTHEPQGSTVRSNTLLAQTYEIRDTAVPAKTLDTSGSTVNEDPLAPPPESPALTGVLTKDELKGRAALTDNGKIVTLYLVNQGKRALIFAGDQAVVLTGQVQEKVKSQYEIIAPPKKTEVKNDVINVAISVLSDGAIPTIFDMATEYQADGAPYYGKDQARRKLAERRFGQRTLFPGESTFGRVYLPVNQAAKATAQLSIPVVVHPTGESLGNLVLPITPAP